MEDVGIPIRSDSLVKANLSEIRTREEVNNGDEREGEKRQKLEVDNETIITTPKQGSNNNNSGGLLDNLLAKLSSPRASPNNNGVNKDFEGSDDNDNVDVQGCNNDVGVNGGGVIDKISSFFHKNDGIEEKKENDNEGSEIAKKDLGQENEGSGIASTNNGGSIISSLIPDGVAPESDEASMLIHSVVHD